jgi:hypothetical protein
VSWTRASLETRVTVLRAQFDGQEFVDAIVELASTLDEDELAMLREIVLAKAKEEDAPAITFPRTEDLRWTLFRRPPRRPPRHPPSEDRRAD